MDMPNQAEGYSRDAGAELINHTKLQAILSPFDRMWLISGGDPSLPRSFWSYPATATGSSTRIRRAPSGPVSFGIRAGKLLAFLSVAVSPPSPASFGIVLLYPVLQEQVVKRAKNVRHSRWEQPNLQTTPEIARISGTNDALVDIISTNQRLQRWIPSKLPQTVIPLHNFGNTTTFHHQFSCTPLVVCSPESAAALIHLQQQQQQPGVLQKSTARILFPAFLFFIHTMQVSERFGLLRNRGPSPARFCHQLLLPSNLFFSSNIRSRRGHLVGVINDHFQTQK
ncbi:hypothetical protein KFK09_018019 [Dendrobium nobile]|uniref:Uncharacterized protein n=1 Tax=Dendrobium nobile TaxID=94219 RepID=A0A8T3AUM8_DENNO|nr:hypothetical protein KFK09_018019 [Dendrobium nobile]